MFKHTHTTHMFSVAELWRTCVCISVDKYGGQTSKTCAYRAGSGGREPPEIGDLTRQRIQTKNSCFCYPYVKHAVSSELTNALSERREKPDRARK